MLTNLLEQLTTLIAEQKDLSKEIKKLKDQDDILQGKIDQIKEILIKEMPTDTYSTEEFTLIKKEDFDLEIKVDELPEYYQKSSPDRAKIKDNIKFGIDIKGVVATPKIVLIIRKK